MGNGVKSNLKINDRDIAMLKGRGAKSYIDTPLSKKSKTEIYNSVKVSKNDKDTVQIFKVQILDDTWYAMKDYECSSMELKRVPNYLLQTLGYNLRTKAFNLNKDSVSDLEVLKRMQLSAFRSK